MDPAEELVPHRITGILYIVNGTFYLFFLLPCLIVIAQKEQLRYSCYKIMLVMTILDILNLGTASFLSGYYSFNGTPYCCGNEVRMQISGRFGLGLFCIYCATAVLLALNRFIDVYSDELAERLFARTRTWIWLIVPFLYGGYYFTPWSSTIVYDSQLDIWLFSVDNTGKNAGLLHLINNSTTAATLVILYSLTCYVIYNRYKVDSNNQRQARRISAMQLQVFVQSMVICSLTVIACLSYVVVQFVPVPPAFYKVTQVTWQIMHGSSGIIYLMLNKTIRNKVGKLISCKKNHVIVTPASPSRSRQRS